MFRIEWINLFLISLYILNQLSPAYRLIFCKFTLMLRERYLSFLTLDSWLIIKTFSLAIRYEMMWLTFLLVSAALSILVLVSFPSTSNLRTILLINSFCWTFSCPYDSNSFMHATMRRDNFWYSSKETLTFLFSCTGCGALPIGWSKSWACCSAWTLLSSCSSLLISSWMVSNSMSFLTILILLFLKRRQTSLT